MPPPAHKPTDSGRRLVRQLAGLGVIVDDIARLTEISDETVRKYYSEDIALGRAEANTKVKRSLFMAATRPGNPNIVAALAWLNHFEGWKSTERREGEGISTLRIEFVAPPANGAAAQRAEDRIVEADTFEMSFGPPTIEGEAEPAKG